MVNRTFWLMGSICNVDLMGYVRFYLVSAPHAEMVWRIHMRIGPLPRPINPSSPLPVYEKSTINNISLGRLLRLWRSLYLDERPQRWVWLDTSTRQHQLRLHWTFSRPHYRQPNWWDNNNHNKAVSETTTSATATSRSARLPVLKNSRRARSSRSCSRSRRFGHGLTSSYIAHFIITVSMHFTFPGQ